MQHNTAGEALHHCIASGIRATTASMFLLVVAGIPATILWGWQESVAKGIVFTMVVPWMLPLVGLLGELTPKRKVVPPAPAPMLSSIPTPEPEVVEKVRLIQVHAPNAARSTTIEGPSGDDIPAGDLKEFVAQAENTRGWSRRVWTNEDVEHIEPYQFRSGNLCDPIYWKKLIQFCSDQNWITEPGPGKRTRLNGITLDEVIQTIDSLLS